ncbi:lysophospholipid acyltransferase family protein [Streptomyces sp. CSDS2]|uniref:lysophospholipid acyltransferase family protein n=1 Tax=Streptomyces sp. CSDS2 TaxID=3055051 RepID=UPI0025AF32E6|nr:lysophospholipid acyltransferase family protein [Streptomyces sp. CSDS2]MDN3265262.1 lysophospholipid acyltransferase family protein [Streptomyces sp. CSDS2]
MLSAWAGALVPVFSDTSVTGTGHLARPPGTGRLLAANHTSFFDPVLLLGTLHRLGLRPAVLATAGLWRVPLLGRALTREGHVPVHRGSRRAPDALRHAADALAAGRDVLIYPEGGLPGYRASHDRPPGRLKSGAVRLALSTGAPVIPLGHAGARRVSSGNRAKQLAGWATAPLRRPRVHVHIGPALRLDTADHPVTTLETALAEAWSTAVRALGEGAGGPAEPADPRGQRAAGATGPTEPGAAGSG